MAGRARTNAILDALDSRRREHFELDAGEPSDLTILDYIGEWVGDGHTIKALAQELTDELGFEVWAETLNRILNRQFTPERVDSVLSASRVRASHSWAEESLEVVDGADVSSKTAVTKAMAQSRARQWMAEKLNPSTFGQKNNTNVSISITALHLDALRAAPKEVTSGITAPELGSVRDGEVLSISDGSTTS